MSVIVDSSFLISLINPLEKQHHDCVRVLNQVSERFIIPVTVLPEVAYILTTRLGYQVMRDFISELNRSDWQIESLTREDLERVDEILSTYWDAKLDFADATIVAMAERLGVQTILTLDRRDFGMIRPSHVDYFDLRP